MNSNTNFSFRGTRRYLQGTTLFDYLIEFDPKPENLDFILAKETDSQCRIVTAREEDNDLALIATYKSKGIKFYVYETLEKISDRRACNEQEILSLITILGTRVSCPLPIAGATFIEVLVAAYKALVSSLPFYKGQRLIFARLLIEHLPNNSDFVIEHRRSLGTRFFEASILVEDQNIGKLIFGSK